LNQIALISCVSKKRSSASKAADLYTSALFKLNLQYTRQLNPDDIYILSAKYGLVALDDEIEPYDVTLNTMGVTERKAWANKVIEQLASRCDLQQDHFIILAGERYRQYLLPHRHPTKSLCRGFASASNCNFLNGG